MRKKAIGLCILLIFTSSIFFPRFVKGYYANIYDMEVDKEAYFLDDVMNVNMSWELQYNPNTEIAFVQIQIFNESNKFVGGSIEYDSVGTFTEVLYFDLQQFDLQFINHSAILYVKFYTYYFQMESTNTMFLFVKTIRVEVFQKDISCEINGLENQILYGDTVNFTAQFSDTDTDLYLPNETVIFQLLYNNTFLYYEDNFTTNSFGTIAININSRDFMYRGPNTFELFLVNNFYKDTKFRKEVDVVQRNMSIKITGLENQIYYGDMVNFTAQFIDAHNNLSIVNETVNFSVVYNNTVYYTANFVTSLQGTVEVIFNSSYYLNFGNNIFDFLIVENDIYKKNRFLLLITFSGSNGGGGGGNDGDDDEGFLKNPLNMNLLTIGGILLILIIIFSIVLFRNKSSKETTKRNFPIPESLRSRGMTRKITQKKRASKR